MTEKELIKQRVRRKLSGNANTHKYEKTINGFLMRCYRNMKSRVTGIQKLKSHLYKNLSILNKEQFYDWSKNDVCFNRLYSNWKLENYNQKMCPSIDRINTLIGYELNNIRWITHSENSRLGAISNSRLKKRSQ